MNGRKALLKIILIGITALGICPEKSLAYCIGRSSIEWSCCSSSSPCQELHGDCDNDNDCSGSLICGKNNCEKFYGAYAHPKSDCCVAPKDENCITKQNGTSCIFPFIYKDKTYNGCTSVDADKSWCATSVDGNGKYVKDNWGYCSSGCKMPSEDENCITKQTGASCIFPFIYKDKTYNGCTSVDADKSWCATSVDGNGKYVKDNWGYCSSGCKMPSEDCNQSCTTFINVNGYGQCKKVSKKLKGPTCYVYSTSTCGDIRESKTNPGKFYSGAACINKAPRSQRQCCGVQNMRLSPRIVNGNDASMNQYPWIAHLWIGTSYCGGSLIASQWILTAHHCTEDVTNPNTIRVTLGDHIRSTKGETNMEKTFSVSKVINHGNSLNMATDIALLKLRQPASLRTYTPICLPEHTTENKYIGKGVWVYGWGATSFGREAADKLQKAKIYVVSNTECDEGFINHGINTTKIETSQICAGTKSGARHKDYKDSCQGDSGGPLSYSRRGIHEQIGIVSYGHGCAIPGLYGVYSYVGFLKDWIEKTMERNGGASLPSRC